MNDIKNCLAKYSDLNSDQIKGLQNKNNEVAMYCDFINGMLENIMDSPEISIMINAVVEVYRYIPDPDNSDVNISDVNKTTLNLAVQHFRYYYMELRGQLNSITPHSDKFFDSLKKIMKFKVFNFIIMSIAWVFTLNGINDYIEPNMIRAQLSNCIALKNYFVIIDDFFSYIINKDYTSARKLISDMEKHLISHQNEIISDVTQIIGGMMVNWFDPDSVIKIRTIFREGTDNGLGIDQVAIIMLKGYIKMLTTDYTILLKAFEATKVV